MSNEQLADTPNAATHVVGLAFTHNRTAVVLLEKNTKDKPSQAWQHGMWNGVGGGVEPGETSRQAMWREFGEEANLETDWEWLGQLRGKTVCLHFFTVDLTAEDAKKVKQKEKERVLWWSVNTALLLAEIEKLVPNLVWILPLAVQREFRFDIYTAKLPAE